MNLLTYYVVTIFRAIPGNTLLTQEEFIFNVYMEYESPKYHVKSKQEPSSEENPTPIPNNPQA